MVYRLITIVCLLMFVAGCGKKVEPTKEVITLQGKSADEVAYTHSEIVAMSDADLAKNISDLRAKLQVKRSTMAPSAGGASVGGGADSLVESDTEGTDTAAPAEDDGVTVVFLALPLEVMTQEQASRK